MTARQEMFVKHVCPQSLNVTVTLTFDLETHLLVMTNEDNDSNDLAIIIAVHYLQNRQAKNVLMETSCLRTEMACVETYQLSFPPCHILSAGLSPSSYSAILDIEYPTLPQIHL